MGNERFDTMAKRPNILITMADDQRHSAMGCAGEPVRTPALDRLAERGTRWSQCCIQGSTSGAVCAPSRAMLHSGRSLFQIPSSICGTGHEMFDRSDRQDVPLLGALLAEGGYHTHGVGKWHNGESAFEKSFQTGNAVFLGGMHDPSTIPLQRWDREGEQWSKAPAMRGHATERFAEAATAFLDGYDDEAPFFLLVAFTAPHDPRCTYKRWHAMYPPDEIPLPQNYLPEHPFDNGTLGIRDELLEEFPRTDTAVRHHLSDYYAMTSHMDDAIGRIHAALERSGRADETLVIHLADHGLAVGSHGLMGKQNLYEHSVRMPLIMAGPDCEAGAVRDEQIYHHDLFPTLLERAGIDLPDDIDGQSLSREDPERESVPIFYSQLHRALRTKRHKLIRYHTSDPPRRQLFDLEADPHETRDLAEAEPGMVEQLDAKLTEWQQVYGDPLLE